MGYAAIVDIAGVFGEENTHRVGTTGIQTGDHVTFRIQDLDIFIDIQSAIGRVAVSTGFDCVVVGAVFMERDQQAGIFAEFLVLAGGASGIVSRAGV